MNPSQMIRSVIIDDETILKEIGAWMLACAVGAYTNKLGLSGDFDTWWWCCTTTWIPRVEKALNISQWRIKKAVLAYCKKNEHLTYKQVFEIERKLHPDKSLGE